MENMSCININSTGNCSLYSNNSSNQNIVLICVLISTITFTVVLVSIVGYIIHKRALRLRESKKELTIEDKKNVEKLKFQAKNDNTSNISHLIDKTPEINLKENNEKDSAIEPDKLNLNVNEPKANKNNNSNIIEILNNSLALKQDQNEFQVNNKESYFEKSDNLSENSDNSELEDEFKVENIHPDILEKFKCQSAVQRIKTINVKQIQTKKRKKNEIFIAPELGQNTFESSHEIHKKAKIFLNFNNDFYTMYSSKFVPHKNSLKREREKFLVEQIRRRSDFTKKKLSVSIHANRSENQGT